MRSVLITVLLLLGAWTVSAADLSGKWTGTIDVKENGESKTVPVLLILKQDGTKLTGSGGGNEDDQHALTKGSVDGDKVTLEAKTDEDTFFLELKVDGDQMTGDVRKGDSARMKISVKRMP
jgi:hypothetical protein